MKKVILLNGKTITLTPNDENDWKESHVQENSDVQEEEENDVQSNSNANSLSIFLTSSCLDDYLDCRDAAKQYAKQNNCIFVHTNPTIHFTEPPFYITYIKYSSNKGRLVPEYKQSYVYESTNGIVDFILNKRKKHNISFDVTSYLEDYTKDYTDSVKGNIKRFCNLHFTCKEIIITL